MEFKDVSGLSNKEILRQQLELLAERSQKSIIEDLARLTSAMCELHDRLK